MIWLPPATFPFRSVQLATKEVFQPSRIAWGGWHARGWACDEAAAMAPITAVLTPRRNRRLPAAMCPPRRNACSCPRCEIQRKTCPLLAQSRHQRGAEGCRLSGAKRTSTRGATMSGNDPKQTWRNFIDYFVRAALVTAGLAMPRSFTDQ